MASILDLMLYMSNDRRMLFYHKDCDAFDYCPRSPIELQHLDPKREIPYKDENNFRFLTFDEIDHKIIMSSFVRQFIKDKEMRKKLFGILRRHNYVNDFVDELHESDLFGEFEYFSRNYYRRMFDEWAEKNNLIFK